MESAWKNQEVAQLVSITFADRKRLERGVNYQLNQASWGSRSSVKNKAEVSVVKADIQRVLPLCLFKALFSMGTLLEHLAEETLCACVWEILEWTKMHLFFFFFWIAFVVLLPASALGAISLWRELLWLCWIELQLSSHLPELVVIREMSPKLGTCLIKMY